MFLKLKKILALDIWKHYNIVKYFIFFEELFLLRIQEAVWIFAV